MDGAFLGLSGGMLLLYNVTTSIWESFSMIKTLLDPSVPAYQKGFALIAALGSALPMLSPALSKRLTDTFIKKFCFPKETLVATDAGDKPIEEIKQGDWVWSRSDATEELALKKVTQLFRGTAAVLITLHIGTNYVQATGDHPFWVADQGWKVASQVRVGDELWTHGGQSKKVTAITHEQGSFTVFNFEVENWHTYFVGYHLVLTHNSCWYSALDEYLVGKYQRYQLRSSQQIAELRHEFETVEKQSFLKWFATTPNARNRFSPEVREYMKRGEVPPGMVVHHKKPLFRGGDNDYGNLDVIDKNYHIANQELLHGYAPGANPYGIAD